MHPDMIPVSPEESVERLRRHVGDPRIGYVLGAGGRDPTAELPIGPHWKTGKVGLDCSGAIAYAKGLDRYQPKRLKVNGGYISTDGMIEDARRKQSMFELVTGVPRVGDIIVWPGIDLEHDNVRERIGHTALISAVPAEWDVAAPDYGALRVIQCGSEIWASADPKVRSKSRRAPAIAETSGRAWVGREYWHDARRRNGDRTLHDEAWGSVIVRLKQLT